MKSPLISLDLAKAHLRLGDDSSQDEWVQAKLEMALTIAEDRTNRSFSEFTQETFPPAIRAAVLLILGTLFDNESDQIVGRSVNELSLTAEKLLLPWRITPYGDVPPAD